MSEITPARGYSWPPFEPGNEAAVRHGAYQPRKVDPLAQEIVATILSDESLAFLHQPSYRLSLWALARAEARVQLLEEWVMTMTAEGMSTPLGKSGGVAPVETLRKLEAHAANLRRDLGLNPMARARLGRDVAATQVDLASVLTQARTDEEATRD